MTGALAFRGFRLPAEVILRTVGAARGSSQA
jgi:hypothetical protein